MKKMVWVAVLVLFPLFSINAFGDGFNPPRPGEHLSGPAIVGTLKLYDDSTQAGYKVDGSFAGTCKGNPVPLELDDYPIKKPFAEIVAEDLMDIRITETEGILPPECYPKKGPQPLIINTVSKFKNDGQSITADIVLLFVVSK